MHINQMLDHDTDLLCKRVLQFELADDNRISLKVLAPQVLKDLPPLGEHALKASSGVKILAMLLHVP